MKRITLLILVVLLSCSLSWAEQKSDPTKENGYTHVKRIINYTIEAFAAAPNTHGTAITRATAACTSMRDMKWIEDPIDSLQAPLRTYQLKTGDCEDFTAYFLTVMAMLGQRPENLGMMLIRYADDTGHMVALFQTEDTAWYVVETGRPGLPPVKLWTYIRICPKVKSFTIFLGLLAINIVIDIEKESEEFTSSFLLPYMIAAEARCRAKGWATE
jgi:hypothetical protein